MKNIRIEYEKIPNVQMSALCRALLAGMEQFYADPENRRRYEEWLRKEADKGGKDAGAGIKKYILRST